MSEKLGPTATKIDEIHSLVQRMSDNMGGLQLSEIEALTPEQARPFAMDLMRAMTLGMQVLAQWGFDAELPDNVVPEAELEYRRSIHSVK